MERQDDMEWIDVGAINYYGCLIVDAEKTANERLALRFADGVTIEIWDDGQSCCESRYMTTDDDLQSIVGHKLMRIEAKDGPPIKTKSGRHDTVFIEIGTDDGFITIVAHNAHNGYYAGFDLHITEKSAA